MAAWALACAMPPISAGAAEDAGAVLVRTAPAAKGALPDVVVLYGSVMPAMDGGMTISLPQEGRVAAIAVTTGERVRAGQALIDFRPSAAAVSALDQAGSALALARTQREHLALLLRQQLATRDQLAQADKAVSDARSALDALRREGGTGARRLTAPFDGIVAAIPVAPGDRTQPGAPLATLTPLDGLVLTAGIEPAERTRLRPGQPATLTPLDGGPALAGSVLRVDAVLDPRTRLVDADLSLPPGAALSGEAFRADVVVGNLAGWLAPHGAVLVDDRGAHLFQAAGGVARRVDVAVRGTVGGTDVVDGPLDPASRLVVQGANQLQDGAAIREDEPAAAPGPGG